MAYRSGAAGSILVTRVYYTTHVKISQKDTSSQQACSKSVNDRVVNSGCNIAVISSSCCNMSSTGSNLCMNNMRLVGVVYWVFYARGKGQGGDVNQIKTKSLYPPSNPCIYRIR